MVKLEPSSSPPKQGNVASPLPNDCPAEDANLLDDGMAYALETALFGEDPFDVASDSNVASSGRGVLEPIPAHTAPEGNALCSGLGQTSALPANPAGPSGLLQAKQEDHDRTLANPVKNETIITLPSI